MMMEEKKGDRAGYPLKMLLEEALERQRNEMMEKNFHILWQVSASEGSSSNNHFKGVDPFKVQVEFDIPIFEG